MIPIPKLIAEDTAVSETEIEKKRLRETCEQFEAILMQYLLKSMRQTVVRAEEPEQAREIYETMLDESFAREMSKNQSNGLAAILYRQLLPAIEGDSSEDSS